MSIISLHPLKKYQSLCKIQSLCTQAQLLTELLFLSLKFSSFVNRRFPYKYPIMLCGIDWFSLSDGSVGVRAWLVLSVVMAAISVFRGILKEIRIAKGSDYKQTLIYKYVLEQFRRNQVTEPLWTEPNLFSVWWSASLREIRSTDWS